MDNFFARPDGPSVRRPGVVLPSEVINLGFLIGTRFARDVGRAPARNEIGVILKHLADARKPLTEEVLEHAWRAALAEIRGQEDDGS